VLARPDRIGVRPGNGRAPIRGRYPSPRSRHRRSALIAACAGLLLTGAGCGGGVPGRAVQRPGTARSAPAFTIAQVRRAFTAFAGRDDRLTPATYLRMLPQLTAPPDEDMLLLAARHPLPPSLSSNDLRTGRMRDATFYVPRITGYPRWFAVVGKAPHGDNALVMVRPSAAAPWRESMVINDQAPAAPLASSFRQVLLDQAGYARAAPAAGPAVAVSPAQVPARYAAVLAGSPVAARLFAPGAATTGWAAADRVRAQLAAQRGWRLRSSYRPAALPYFALRCQGGGALELFTVQAERTWTGVSAAPVISLGGGGLPIADVAAGSLTSAQRGTTVRETDLYEMLAIVPAWGRGRVSLPLAYPLDGTYTVPEYGGGLTAVTLRP
jgi:hypothetical protein